MPTVFKDGIISKGGVNQGVNVPVGSQNPTQSSQSRNSKTPSQAMSDLAGSNLSFGQSVVQNGFKQTVEDVFSNGASGLMSMLRGKGIPVNGLSSLFGGGFNGASWARNDDEDWRVKLSIPAGMSLEPLLQSKLNETNGMIFPYTPSIIFAHSASYSQIKPTHSNYPFPIYQNSQPDNLQITGEFYVEGDDEGAYWVACIHYLRTITKMAYGQTQNAGTPPPIVNINGYGDYVFKNVPIVVTNFSVDLPPDVDYIYVPSVNTYAPTRSTITVVAIPTYSRREVQGFSLDTFVKGGYAKGRGGFI